MTSYNLSSASKHNRKLFSLEIFRGSNARKHGPISNCLKTLAFALTLFLFGFGQASADTFQWANTDELTNPRSLHTGTELLDGRVLVAGGYGRKFTSGPVFDTAEVYDPGSDTWSATGKLTVPRAYHTATTLADGRVLLAGGESATGGPQLSSAELYDPTTNRFSPTGSMQARRFGHIAVKLLDGRVLVAGGLDGSNLQRSAEIFNPSTGSWSPTGSMNLGRSAANAVLLHSGQVLVIGGGAPLQSVEIYNPATGTWSFTGSLVELRLNYYTATLLQDGRVLVVGGGGSGGVFALRSCELYDPTTGSWSETGKLRKSRNGHGAVLLPDGHVLVTGGQNGTKVLPKLTETYDPATGLWTNSGYLLAGRRYHSTNVLPDSGVLVVGGSTDTAVTPQCELGVQATGESHLDPPNL